MRARSITLLAAIALSAGCSKRPLPAGSDGSIGAAPGGDGAAPPTCGNGGARLELIGSPLLVLDSPPVSGNLYTTLLWTGEEYLFVWRIFSGDAVLMQRIDASGQGVGGNIRVRDYENACDFAWGNGRLAAAWVRENGKRNDLTFQTFDRLGRPLSDEVVLRSSENIPLDGGVSYGPRIAATASGFAIAWTEDHVWVAIVDPAGRVLRDPVAAGSRLAGTPQLSLTAAARIVVGVVDPAAPPNAVAFASTFSTDLTPVGDVVLDGAAFRGSAQIIGRGADVLALWAHGDPDLHVRIGVLDPNGTHATIGDMAAPVTGRYRDLSPAVWQDDHVVVLWDSSDAGATGVKLSRHAPNGERQGATIDLPTASTASRLYVTAHDAIVGFTWTEEAGGGYQAYFQQARSCP